MVQRYSIVLWRKADKKERSFEEVALEAYETLDILQKYPVSFRPNYVTRDYKKNSFIMKWDFDVFCEELKKGVNKEGSRVVEDLGYSVSFFSSEKEEESCSISIAVGVKDNRFINSLIIKLPYGLDLKNNNNVSLVRSLFEMLISKYKPFFGCISNSFAMKKEGRGYIENDIPTCIHWMNYWSDVIVANIGEKKLFQMAKSIAEVFFENGIFSISNRALDFDNKEDVEYYVRINSEILQ